VPGPRQQHDVSGPVVVGWDGSAAAGVALDRAIEEASSADARLVVVTVSAIPLESEGPMGLGALDGPPMPLPLGEPPEVEHLFAAARERIEPAGVSADYVWDSGEPADAIVREARNRQAGVIVLGKGHHSRLGRWLGADVAAGVERAVGADCRVIVVDA
jgi:nucleotide-binding universal stress UspA family protein